MLGYLLSIDNYIICEYIIEIKFNRYLLQQAC